MSDTLGRPAALRYGADRTLPPLQHELAVAHRLTPAADGQSWDVWFRSPSAALPQGGGLVYGLCGDRALVSRRSLWAALRRLDGSRRAEASMLPTWSVEARARAAAHPETRRWLVTGDGLGAGRTVSSLEVLPPGADTLQALPSRCLAAGGARLHLRAPVLVMRNSRRWVAMLHRRVALAALGDDGLQPPRAELPADLDGLVARLGQRASGASDLRESVVAVLSRAWRAARSSLLHPSQVAGFQLYQVDLVLDASFSPRVAGVRAWPMVPRHRAEHLQSIRILEDAWARAGVLELSRDEGWTSLD